jgi:lysosomal Pro-X carboxypeptidase
LFVSIPFGVLNQTTLQYLTIEQALADFSTLVVDLKRRQNSIASPVIAVGGSYGGVLSLFARLKQPNVFAGALASSAPPLKSKLRASNAFNVIVTNAYGNVSSQCPSIVRKAWQELESLSHTVAGRAEIGRSLALCRAPQTTADAMAIYGWLTGALETMVQYG